ncbi:MAG: SpoIIE family protein phosphatase [Bacteroidia bacterium]|nr:SpoIIE family protein phosphatase [Bacteroidia bacterium]
MMLSQLTDLKLQTLLRLTMAINRNSPSSELIHLYADSLEHHFNIRNILFLIHRNDSWELRYPKTKIPEFARSYLDADKEMIIEHNHPAYANGFRFVLPVLHKNLPLGMVLLGWEKEPSPPDLEFIKTLTHVLMMAIENKRLAKLEMARSTLNREISLASDIQRKLLPSDLPMEGHLKVCGFYLPYYEVGGDYYDWIPLNRHEFLFCIADVSGKGIPAALLMSNIQACLRSLIGFTHNLKDIILEINKRVWQSAKGEQFASMFLGKINLRSQQLTTINAGHCSPLLIENGNISLMDKGCTLLGISEDLKQVDVDIREYAGQIGIFLYTDGWKELLDEYPSIPQNFTEQLVAGHFTEPEVIIQTIEKEVKHLSEVHELKDDVAVLSIFTDDLCF